MGTVCDRIIDDIAMEASDDNKCAIGSIEWLHVPKSHLLHLVVYSDAMKEIKRMAGSRLSIDEGD